MKAAKLALVVAIVAIAAEDLPLIQPDAMAARLSAKPVVIQVGPGVLYRSNHIPGALHGGPASTADGLALLKSAVAKLPRDREIAIYCGCCPWDHCPNVKPAVRVLKEMGFTNVKAVYLADNFKNNWIDRGYPVER